MALLQDGADVGVGGVRGQGEYGVRGRVSQGNCGDQGRLGRYECGCSGGCPLQRLRVALQGVGEWLQGPGDAGQETAVEDNHAQELLQLFDVTWLRKIFNGRDVSLKRSDPVLVDVVTQELDCRRGEGALGRVDRQAVLLEDGEELTEVLQVLLQGAAGDDVVVEVGEDEGQVSKKLVHEPLESLGGVAKTERHEQVLKKAERRYEGRFWHIGRVHRDLVVPLDEVDDGEELASV